MHIEINTDHNINGDARLREVVEAAIHQHLGPLESRLSDVEVHLKDIRGPKGGVDIRATVEARPEGLRPMATHDDATGVEAAIKGAAKKMRTRLDSEFGKLSDRG